MLLLPTVLENARQKAVVHTASDASSYTQRVGTRNTIGQQRQSATPRGDANKPSIVNEQTGSERPSTAAVSNAAARRPKRRRPGQRRSGFPSNIRPWRRRPTDGWRLRGGYLVRWQPRKNATLLTLSRSGRTMYCSYCISITHRKAITNSEHNQAARKSQDQQS